MRHEANVDATIGDGWAMTRFGAGLTKKQPVSCFLAPSSFAVQDGSRKQPNNGARALPQGGLGAVC